MTKVSKKLTKLIKALDQEKSMDADILVMETLFSPTRWKYSPEIYELWDDLSEDVKVVLKILVNKEQDNGKMFCNYRSRDRRSSV